ncbi:hypothetical protein C9021_23035 [Escherichia coli]|nr:hypothetical protein C9209_22270 [Escherichia coli]TJE71954.1 hypothetical protein C9212_22020 [Escherichia coli]TJE73496.1 hypothetical protein C9208_22440 [Escherichia coli]TJE86587.1 hypothetical protein C9211_22680 [Escherichia coli]TJM78651.1 hypothetical protein C9042_23400 [Escherichia coli]
MRCGKNRLKATPTLTRTLSIINSINMPHQCMDDSRLASFVSLTARLKAVWQAARCAVSCCSVISHWLRRADSCVT